jgi:hypothetical protein
MLFSLAAFAEQTIETIRLKHQLAAQIEPLIVPLLSDSAHISSTNNLIILKAEPSELAELKTLILGLDVPLKSIRLSFIRTNHNLQDKSSVSWQTHADSQIYEIRTIENKETHIDLSQLITIQNESLIQMGNQPPVLITQFEERVLAKGFSARLDVVEEKTIKVTLNFQHSHYSDKDKPINYETVMSSIYGQLGEWIEVAQTQMSVRVPEKDGTLYRTNNNHSHYYLYMRVDEL